MKQLLVKIPDHEWVLMSAVFAEFAGTSPQQIMRALVLNVGRLSVPNALAKQAVAKARHLDKLSNDLIELNKTFFGKGGADEGEK